MELSHYKKNFFLKCVCVCVGIYNRRKHCRKKEKKKLQRDGFYDSNETICEPCLLNVGIQSNFNSLSNCLGVLYIYRLGNHVHCTFISIFFPVVLYELFALSCLIASNHFHLIIIIGELVLYGISTLEGYLMPNSVLYDF